MMNLVLVFFESTLKSDLKEVQFTGNYIFLVKAPLLYLEGAPMSIMSDALTPPNGGKWELMSYVQ